VVISQRADARSEMVATLSDIIEPMTCQEFMDSVWDKDFVYIPGCDGRFKDLFPWQHLDRVLEEHRLPPPRLQLYRNGKAIPPSRYQSQKNSWINSDALLKELAAGATLILNHAEETYRPLRNLVENLESSLRTRIHANAYAGWGVDAGFARHCDPQDSFVCQVSGSKKWQVWRPTRMHPLSLEMVPDPVDASIWDGTLSEGSALYLPRGWWHVATPIGEPCLHLTVTMPNPKGIDLLQWLGTELCANKHVRQNLPTMSESDEKRRYCDELLRLVTQVDTTALVERYLSQLADTAPRRPSLNLPILNRVKK
jgi:hypothetical protein